MKLILLILLVFLSCTQNSKNTAIFSIKGYKILCSGVGARSCLVVSEDQGDFEYFYSGIEGFDFEWGFDQKIEVEIYEISNPPADASSSKYKLISQIGKVQNSDNYFELFINSSFEHEINSDTLRINVYDQLLLFKNMAQIDFFRNNIDSTYLALYIDFKDKSKLVIDSITLKQF